MPAPRRLARWRVRLGWIVTSVALLASLAQGVVTAPPAAAQSASFTFEGGGWGHGVGMSQYGAYGRAAAGHTYDQILGAYYSGTTVETVAQPADIRVHLATVPDVTLTTPVGMTLSIDGVAVTAAPVGSPVNIATTGAGFAIDAGGPLCPAGGCTGQVLRIALSTSSPVGVSATGRRYARGHLDLVQAGDGRFHLIVGGLSMQDYLLGLAEMPQSWPMEALRAQAVAGRSYAHDTISRRRAGGPIGWDLVATTGDQVYAGYDQETTPTGGRWIDAVTSTADRVVSYGGTVVQAFYSSSNGGHSEDSGYVFATSYPYLAPVADPYDDHQNPYATWTRTYTADELTRWTGAQADTAVGTVTAVTISGSIGTSGRIDRATVTLAGSDGTETVSGKRFRAVVNAGVSADGGGRDRQLLSTNIRPVGFLTLEPLSPTGHLDAVAQAGDGSGDIALTGWALDGNTAAAIPVHVYVDGRLAGAAEASRPRPGVASLFPLHGPGHGFELQVPAGLGRHEVCAFAINAGPGTVNSQIGCRTVDVIDRAPGGRIDAVAHLGGTTGALAGWALDIDNDAPLQVHVYVNGQLATATTADLERPDIAAFFGVSPQHGFLTAVPVTAGNNRICAYGINAGPGTTNALLSCADLLVADALPVGAIDAASPSRDRITLTGWALDPDRSDPVMVRAYVDDQVVTTAPADRPRPDVAAFFGGAEARGFELTVDAGPGRHEVCVVAVNAGPGTVDRRLGCRSVTV